MNLKLNEISDEVRRELQDGAKLWARLAGQYDAQAEFAAKHDGHFWNQHDSNGQTFGPFRTEFVHKNALEAWGSAYGISTMIRKIVGCTSDEAQEFHDELVRIRDETKDACLAYGGEPGVVSTHWLAEDPALVEA